MLKVGDKIRVIDYGLFSINLENREEKYVISKIFNFKKYKKYYFNVKKIRNYL